VTNHFAPVSSLNPPSKSEEGLLHTLVSLGTGLKEAQAKLVGELPALLERDGALLVPVALVADKDLVDTRRRVLLDLGVPRADVCLSALRCAARNPLLKLFSSVTSYTIRMPMAPR
jgi:hypothetical protein